MQVKVLCLQCECVSPTVNKEASRFRDSLFSSALLQESSGVVGLVAFVRRMWCGTGWGGRDLSSTDRRARSGRMIFIIHAQGVPRHVARTPYPQASKDASCLTVVSFDNACKEVRGVWSLETTLH